MAKFSPITTLDALLDKVATATRITVCSAQPATFADIATYALASATKASTDYTKTGAAGVARNLAVSQSSSLAIATSGDGSHVVLDDGTALTEVTTCATQTLTAGGTVSIPAWNVVAQQPT